MGKKHASQYANFGSLPSKETALSMLISKSSLFIFMEVNKSYFFIRHHFYKNSP